MLLRAREELKVPLVITSCGAISRQSLWKKIATKVVKIGSKNAGPYWLTVDVFCGSESVYSGLVNALDATAVAAFFRYRWRR